MDCCVDVVVVVLARCCNDAYPAAKAHSISLSFLGAVCMYHEDPSNREESGGSYDISDDVGDSGHGPHTPISGGWRWPGAFI